MANAMSALANITLSGTSTSVTFSNIPGTFRDLRLVVNSSGVGNDAAVQFNGDTASNYSRVYMAGQGTTSAVSGTESTTYLAFAYISSNMAVGTLDIMDYSVTDKHKLTLSRGGDIVVDMAIAGRWANTAAITSIKVIPVGANPFASGSTFALYGIVS